MDSNRHYTFVDRNGVRVDVEMTLNEARLEVLARELARKARGRRNRRASMGFGAVTVMVEMREAVTP